MPTDKHFISLTGMHRMIMSPYSRPKCRRFHSIDPWVWACMHISRLLDDDTGKFCTNFRYLLFRSLTDARLILSMLAR